MAAIVRSSSQSSLMRLRFLDEVADAFALLQSGEPLFDVVAALMGGGPINEEIDRRLQSIRDKKRTHDSLAAHDPNWYVLLLSKLHVETMMSECRCMCCVCSGPCRTRF